MKQAYEQARQKLEDAKLQLAALQANALQIPDYSHEILVRLLHRFLLTSQGTERDLARQLVVLDKIFRHFYRLTPQRHGEMVAHSALRLALRAQQNCRQTYKKIKNHSFKGEQTRQKAIQTRQKNKNAPLDT